LMPFYFRKECPLNSGYLSIRLLVVHRVQVRRIRLQEEGHQHVVAFLCQRHSLRQGRQLPVNAQGKPIRHQ
ncbi:hypothetical protein UQ79_20560, partial [Shigella dysenteriae]